jgi:hypothetical protein
MLENVIVCFQAQDFSIFLCCIYRLNFNQIFNQKSQFFVVPIPVVSLNPSNRSDANCTVCTLNTL